MHASLDITVRVPEWLGGMITKAAIEWRGVRVLITGATGFIGSHLSRRLVELGAIVHAVSRTPRHDSTEEIRWWTSHLDSVETVRTLLNDVRPAFVFHLAGYVTGSPDLGAVIPSLQSNLVTTVNLLTAATEQGGCRVLIAASLEEPEVGGSEGVPPSPYAASKWATTVYARMFHTLYQTQVVMGRVFLAYGPSEFGSQKLVPHVTLSLLRGDAPQLSSGRRLLDWIHIEDVIDGLLTLAHAQGVEGRVVDIGSGKLTSVRTVVEHLVDLTKARTMPVFGALPDRPMEHVRRANTEECLSLIGWASSISLRDGLERTVAWYQNRLAQPDGRPR